MNIVVSGVFHGTLGLGAWARLAGHWGAEYYVRRASWNTWLDGAGHWLLPGWDGLTSLIGKSLALLAG